MQPDSCVGHRLARALAAVPGGPSWEKVERQLYSRVPRPGEGGTPGYTLSPRAQQAVLSLGIFYLESDFRHSDRILDCLLGLQRSLATAAFPEPGPRDSGSRLPAAEVFSFSLHTLLNDVATHNRTEAGRVLEAQLDLMAGVLEQLQQMRSHEAPSPFHARQAICKVAVPVLLGLARAMGRFAPPSEDFLLAKILPRAGPGLGGPSGKAGASQEESVKGFSNFRYSSSAIEQAEAGQTSRERSPIFWRAELPKLLHATPAHPRRRVVVKRRLSPGPASAPVAGPGPGLLVPRLVRSISAVSGYSGGLLSRSLSSTTGSSRGRRRCRAWLSSGSAQSDPTSTVAASGWGLSLKGDWLKSGSSGGFPGFVYFDPIFGLSSPAREIL